MHSISASALDARARRAAKRVGYIARKSRRLRGTLDNLGGFTLIEARTNIVRRGIRCELSAEEVIEFCSHRK